jgi:cyclase
MAARRIIPTLLVRGRTLVKGQCYDSWRSIGHALQGAQVHARRQVDEILLLDIAATAENRGPDLDMVRELTEGCFIPVTIGGGVRSLGDIDQLLRAGADKVSIGTGAWELPSLIQRAAGRFGSQAIVVSLDVRGDGSPWRRCGTKPCRLARQKHTFTVKNYAQLAQDMGAGEILLSSIDRDGTMAGYDLELIREVAQAVSVPVIASGGCSGYPDMLEAFKAGADACAAGALFAFSDCVPKGAAQYLAAHGVNVRVP